MEGRSAVPAPSRQRVTRQLRYGFTLFIPVSLALTLWSVQLAIEFGIRDLLYGFVLQARAVVISNKKSRTMGGTFVTCSAG